MWRAFAVGALGLCTGLGIGFTPTSAEAGTIGNACLQTNRPSATRQLCSCIDRVAKQEMSRTERRKAARFFKDPHRAQEVRQSDRPSDEKLWQTYKAFSQKAAKVCG